jgi:hypothetical protein
VTSLVDGGIRLESDLRLGFGGSAVLLRGTKSGGGLLAVGCKYLHILVVYKRLIIIATTDRVNVKLEGQRSWEIGGGLVAPYVEEEMLSAI